MSDDNYNEFMSRSPEQVYLAIMDKLNVKIDFERQPEERPMKSIPSEKKIPRHLFSDERDHQHRKDQ